MFCRIGKIKVVYIDLRQETVLVACKVIPDVTISQMLVKHPRIQFDILSSSPIVNLL